MGGHRDRGLTAHAGPAHPPESPHVRSGPTSGGREPEEAAGGWACAAAGGWLLPAAGSPTNWKSGQLGRELEPWRAGVGCSDLGPGGKRAWRGQGAGERCGLLSLPLDLCGPRRELGKSFGVDCCLGPPLRRATCAAPGPRPSSRPARCPPSPPGRARAAREPLHQPGPGRPRVPEPPRPGRRGTRGGEPRPSPGARGKVTSRGSPTPRTRRTTPCAFPLSQPLKPLLGAAFPHAPSPVSSLLE